MQTSLQSALLSLWCNSKPVPSETFSNFLHIYLFYAYVKIAVKEYTAIVWSPVSCGIDMLLSATQSGEEFLKVYIIWRN